MLPRTDYDTLVVTTPGLEAVTLRELSTLDVAASGPLEPGAIPVRVPLATLYAMNLNLRTASRITLQIATFRARTFAELERKGKGVPWGEWLGHGTRVRLRVTCRKSRLYHSDAVAERVAGAIAARSGADVAIAQKTADDGDDAQLLLVRLLRDECTIRLDSSGANLHRRGYRQALAKAPLRETLAAAMLLGAEWNPAAPLIDPLCGSGTIAIEAALLALNIAPGSRRSFAFMQWPNFSRRAWKTVLDRARAQERTCTSAPIVAADRDAGAIEATIGNAQRARVRDHIDIRQQPLSALDPPETPGWLVTNPPYGVRVGEREQLKNLYASLGRLSRERLAAWHVALLSAHPMLEGQLGLPLEERFQTLNGGLTVRLLMRVPLKRAGAASSQGGRGASLGKAVP